MSEKHEIKIGDMATVKVGRNEAKVKILKPMAGGNAFMVKSLSSGKEFIMPGSRLNMPTVSIDDGINVLKLAYRILDAVEASSAKVRK